MPVSGEQGLLKTDDEAPLQAPYGQVPIYSGARERLSGENDQKIYGKLLYIAS